MNPVLFIAVRQPKDFEQKDVFSSRSAKFLLRSLGHDSFTFICFDGDNDAWYQQIEKQVHESTAKPVFYVAGKISQQKFSSKYLSTAQHNFNGFKCFELTSTADKPFLALFGPDPIAAATTRGCAEVIEDLKSALAVADVLTKTHEFPVHVARDIQQLKIFQQNQRAAITELLGTTCLHMPLSKSTVDRVKILVRQCGVHFTRNVMNNSSFVHRLPLMLFWTNVQFISTNSVYQKLLCGSNPAFIRQLSKPQFLSAFKKFHRDYGCTITSALCAKPAFSTHLCDENFTDVFGKIYSEVGESAVKIFSVTKGVSLFENFVQNVGTVKTMELFSNSVFINNLARSEENCLSDLANYAEKFGHDIAIACFSSPNFITLHDNRETLDVLISVLYTDDEYSVDIIMSLLKSNFAKLLHSNQDEALKVLQLCTEIFGLKNILCVCRNNLFFTRFVSEEEHFVKICKALVKSTGPETGAALLSCYTVCKNIGSAGFTNFFNRIYRAMNENLLFTARLVSENCFTTRMFTTNVSKFDQLFQKFLNNHGVENTVKIFGNGSLCVRWIHKSFRVMFYSFLEQFGIEKTVDTFSSQAFVCCFKFNNYNFEESNKITQTKFQQVMTEMKDPPLHSSKFCKHCADTEDVPALVTVRPDKYDDVSSQGSFLHMKRILLESSPPKFIEPLQFCQSNKRKNDVHISQRNVKQK